MEKEKKQLKRTEMVNRLFDFGFVVCSPVVLAIYFYFSREHGFLSNIYEVIMSSICGILIAYGFNEFRKKFIFNFGDKRP